ncbi:MAG TPA: gluconate 2-dehydrogenase subunit 3 family protein [Terriglobales bacterium]|nr:gluconate 2-dehydrogenase subunit 3 family protein [Terriglobales bacterium]
MSTDDDKPVPENAREGLTRREWLLRLGEFTALAGVAGLAPPLALSLGLTEQQAAALPPGLYDPSPKHLIHALSSRALPAIPPGSETDYVQPPQGPFRPQFFSLDEFKVVSRLVEILLGKVNSGALAETAEWVDLRFNSAAGVREAARRLDPLHHALAVAYYGEAHVVELETSDPQAVARAGLAALVQRAQQLGNPFLDLPASQQTDLAREMSQQPEETPLRRFYDLLRREAIHGYYTSQAGLKELDYQGNAYHTQCPGCEKS